MRIKHRSIHLSKISNIKYTHITVNVGAAEKCYKAICINPYELKDVILYLGYFHDFRYFLVTVENFLVTVGLRRFYVTQECVQWVEEDHFYQGSLKTKVLKNKD